MHLSHVSGHTWRRQPVVTAGVALEAGLLRRDPARLAGPLLAGELLADVLLRACANDDLPALNANLRRWVELAAAEPFATADNVVVAGSGWSLIDASYALDRPVVAEVALAHVEAVRGRAADQRRSASVVDHYGR